MMRQHWLFTTLLVVGIGLRLSVVYAYRPAILYVDSMTIYLNHLPGSRMPYTTIDSPDPLGYNIFWLRPVLAIGNLMTVVELQHLLGLLMAVVTYVVLVRRGAWRWLAALATAPVLLDAYQLEIEHTIMSDSFFEALLVAAFAVLAWHRRPGWRAVIAAGLLLGVASTVRAVGAVLIVALAVYVVIRAKGWPAPWWRGKTALTVLLVAMFAVPLYGYHLHTRSQSAGFEATATRTNVLYARVATFVDCAKITLPADERVLCPAEPVGQRRSPDYYAHDPRSPYFQVKIASGTAKNDLVNDFSMRAIRAQPLGLVAAVATDAAKAFSWNHDDFSNPDAPTERWRFQATFPIYPSTVTLATVAQAATEFGGGPPRYAPLPAELLREYQLHLGYTPGPVMAVAMLAALAAVAGLTRRRRPPTRWPALLYLAGGVLVLLVSDAFEFTWRYQLPGLVLVPAAGALGLTAIFWRPRRPSFPEAVDRAAIEDFERDYGTVPLAPVVVVIAAYNEADNIGAVIDRIPSVTRDMAGARPLPVSTLVVVDGGRDGTADVARAAGAYTVALGRNRGQGAALRLGYYLARTYGGDLIVTTDADGQYDIAQLPALLEPLRNGTADFVTGSRRLGTDESDDHVRRTGVRVFARLVSGLTGRKVTDTSFGFRAMWADVTARVQLDQPQYQSSELLISLLMQGRRVTEVPMTMRRRRSGASKKGNNVRYGMRYAGVVFSTWSREVSRRWRSLNTNRSRIRNLRTNMTANEPK
jgi:glycosyltransferase involved in cell wall biosynthesis